MLTRSLSHRHWLLGSLLAVFMSLGMAPPALAVFGVGDVVYDPSNFLENLLTEINTFQTTVNQGRQIANEVQMLANQVTQITNQSTQIAHQVKNLTTLDGSILDRLGSTITAMVGVLHTAEGLTYTLGDMQGQFETLYPQFGQAARPLRDLGPQITRWNQQVRDAMQDAMRAQSVAEHLTADQATLEQAMTASQAAEGNLQVSQAANQLSGLMTTQLMRLEQVTAATGRVLASDLGKQAAEADAARARAQYLLHGLGTTSTAPLAELPAFQRR
jgi:P-type conjugative transfer protein TrbJ